MRFNLFLTFLFLLPTALYADHNSFHEAAEDYLEFVDHRAGIITPQQLHQAGLENVMLVNMNAERQFKNGDTLPNSIHMDWRQVLKRHNEIPHDKTVVVYCNTMLYSSRAQLLLSMDGYSNVLLLQGGLKNWNNYISSLAEE